MSHALKTDLYQLTMMQAYFSTKQNPSSTFDYFVRKIPSGAYLVVAGLPYVLSYLEELRFDSDDLTYLASQNLFTPDFLEYLEGFRFSGDVKGMPEGELAFPREPILRVTAPLMEAQLIETFILNKMNFSTLIATKSSRVVYAAKDKPVLEFGLRRAHGEAGLEASRASFIGGCFATSNVEAGKVFKIPVSGTMAHSFVTSFPSELEAFRAYAATYPQDTVLLIDTYDTIEGAKNAIAVAKELEAADFRLKGVRLDSGDLGKLAREVRKIFDEARLDYVKIFVSSDLNEWKINDLCDEGAPIDAWGVGTEMVTARPEPALGGVYKLVEIEDENGNTIPKMKLSNDSGKITLPGKKTVWRLYTPHGFMEKDVIALEEEDISHQSKKEILVPLVERGDVVYVSPSLSEIRKRAIDNLSHLPGDYLSLDGAPVYLVELSPRLEALTRDVTKLLQQALSTYQ